MRTLLLEDCNTFSDVVNSANGIYVHQIFVERYEKELALILPTNALTLIDDIKEGPKNEYYNEACSDLFTMYDIIIDGYRYFEYEGGISILSEDEYDRVDWDEIF